MTELVQQIVDTLATDPYLAGLIVFLVATGEAVFILGFFVPSTPILVGAGTLIGLGKLSFWPIFLLTSVGAAVGDAISYWIGWYYKDRLKTVWPFSRYESLVVRGEAFFRDHGAKSIFLGRFVPGVKAVVPGIAGMMNMNLARFTIINVLSAFVWAAAHILPGILAGAALDALGTISTRLAIAVALVLGLIFVAVLVVRWFLIAIRPLLVGSHRRLVAFANRHNTAFSRWFARTFDESNPRTVGMIAATVSIMVGMLGLVWIIDQIDDGGRLVRIDLAIRNLFESLRTPPGDAAMVLVTMLGDAPVTTAVAASVVIWLIWHDAWARVVGFLTAMISASLFVPLLKLLLERSRPIEIYAGAEIYAFPSGHATINAVLYGIIALMVAHDRSLGVKALVFSVATGFVTLISLSRVYLGAHWASDVIGGMLFGMAIAAAFAFVFGHVPGIKRNLARLALVTIGMVAAAGSWHIAAHFDQSFARYRVQPTPQVMAEATWLDQTWSGVASNRIDLGGLDKEPLILQWAGPVGPLAERFLKDGWFEPVGWSIVSAGTYVSGSARTDELPVLPRFHVGREPILTLVKRDGEAPDTARWVLRVWPSGLIVSDGQGTRHPLLVGAIVKERLKHPLGQVSVSAWDRRERFPLSALEAILPDTVERLRPASGRRPAINLLLGPLKP
ncbi:MAG: VTT domain-containing protein [Hyphomicrobiaceae bacterium]